MVFTETVELPILTDADRVPLIAVKVVLPYMMGYPFLRICKDNELVGKVEGGALMEVNVNLYT